MGSDTLLLIETCETQISIHAPRMGSDNSAAPPAANSRNFNPRSPDGERQNAPILPGNAWKFQSTLPGWGATNPLAASRISLRFQSTLPGWGATRRYLALFHRVAISIHAPRMGSDRENGHLRPRYGQNHPFSTLIVSQIVVDVLGTVRKSQKTPAH